MTEKEESLMCEANQVLVFNRQSPAISVEGSLDVLVRKAFCTSLVL